MAVDVAALGIPMHGLRSSRIGDVGNDFPPDADALPKWFLAAYLMGRDKRGVSAKFLEREHKVAFQAVWSLLHMLCHGLSEDPAQPLGGYLEADESHIGGRGDPQQSWPQHQQCQHC